MEQIEIILRTTASSGKVTEQLLAKFDTEKPTTESDRVLQYSGLCIDPDKHQVSYQGNVLPLTETYEFQTISYLASQPGRVFTKEQIYQAVWKEEPVDVNSAVSVSSGISARSCGRLQRKNISKQCGESDTNL